jgi:hypothetical protein
MQKHTHNREQIVNLGDYSASVLIIGNVQVTLRDFHPAKWAACGKIEPITTGRAQNRELGARSLILSSVLTHAQYWTRYFSRSPTDFYTATVTRAAKDSSPLCPLSRLAVLCYA